jgi:plastocyanin
MTPLDLPLPNPSPAVRRAGALGVLMVALLTNGCASGATSTPASDSIAEVASAGPEAPTPIPTLEATTEEATEAPSGAITMTVGPGPRFTPDQITAPAGTVVFFLDTQQIDEGIVHNLVIATAIGELPLAKSATLTHEHSVTFTVRDMEPGTYEFWCTFEGHLEGGMKGTLTIT